MKNEHKSLDDIREGFLHCLHQIAPEIDLQSIRPETILREEFEIDSVDFLRLLVLLHEELNVDIPEKDYSKLATLESSLNYLQEQKS